MDQVKQDLVLFLFKEGVASCKDGVARCRCVVFRLMKNYTFAGGNCKVLMKNYTWYLCKKSEKNGRAHRVYITLGESPPSVYYSWGTLLFHCTILTIHYLSPYLPIGYTTLI